MHRKKERINEVSRLIMQIAQMIIINLSWIFWRPQSRLSFLTDTTDAKKKQKQKQQKKKKKGKMKMTKWSLRFSCLSKLNQSIGFGLFNATLSSTNEPKYIYTCMNVGWQLTRKNKCTIMMWVVRTQAFATKLFD